MTCMAKEYETKRKIEQKLYCLGIKSSHYYTKVMSTQFPKPVKET